MHRFGYLGAIGLSLETALIFSHKTEAGKKRAQALAFLTYLYPVRSSVFKNH